MRFVDHEDGWVAIVDGDRELMRLRPPNGGGAAEIKRMSADEIEAICRQIQRFSDSHRHGAN